ncbi:MAG: serine/threonine protein kinase, partial [Candidatus Sumerlaeia bacterium]|nr:serine/threonine protein kinase [Candidatus Sumerlaeia bacterium]
MNEPPNNLQQDGNDKDPRDSDDQTRSSGTSYPPSCEETFSGITMDSEQGRFPRQGDFEDDSEEGELIRAWLFGDAEYRYVLTHLIAKGGGGEVWEGEHLVLKRVIAAKRPHFSWHVEAKEAAEIKDESQSSSSGSGDSPKLRAFLREAMVGAVLEHPNILPVYDLGKDMDGSPLIIMRLVQGRPWSKCIEQEQRELSRDEFLFRNLPILVQVANAVAYAHSRGIIHRDIKPSQVMIGDYGEVQLMDWGLATVLNPETLPKEWEVEDAPLRPSIDTAVNPAGTPAYMAPEQTVQSTEGLGPWTDVFLLGSTLFYILTGRTPYSSETTAQAIKKASTRTLDLPTKVAPDRYIPPELESLVMDAMTADWKERNVTVRQFVRRIEVFLAGYTNKAESNAIVEHVGKMIEQGMESYRELTNALTQLVRARGLWAGNPRIDEQRYKVLAMYAAQATRRGDLNLAQVQIDRLPDGEEKSRLLADLIRAERQIKRRENQRRFAFVTAGILMIAVIGNTIFALTQWSRAKEEVVRSHRAERQARESQTKALQAMETAEMESYFSGIGFAAGSIREGNPEKALETLLERVPTHNRQWEWGALMAQLNSDNVTLVKNAVQNRRVPFHSAFSP